MNRSFGPYKRVVEIFVHLAKSAFLNKKKKKRQQQQAQQPQAQAQGK